MQRDPLLLKYVHNVTLLHLHTQSLTITYRAIYKEFNRRAVFRVWQHKALSLGVFVSPIMFLEPQFSSQYIAEIEPIFRNSQSRARFSRRAQLDADHIKTSIQ